MPGQRRQRPHGSHFLSSHTHFLRSPRAKLPLSRWRSIAKSAATPVLVCAPPNRSFSLRQDPWISDPGGKQRTLICAFDGGYTNSTVLRQPPPHTIFIGRIRKDARLCFTARPRFDESPWPTSVLWTLPRQHRNSSAPTTSEPWQTLPFVHSGMEHQLRYKRRRNMMWRTAGATQILQLIVIAPLAYRPRKEREAPLSRARISYMYGCGNGSARDHRSLFSALGHRGQLPRSKDSAGAWPGSGAQPRSSVESAPALGRGRPTALLLVAARARIRKLARRRVAPTEMVC